MNENDSERIAMFLENKKYKPISKMEEADLIIVNACSVRQTAVDRILGLKPKINKLKSKNSKLETILTGCVLKSDKKEFNKFFDKILSIKEFLGEDYLSNLEPKCRFSKSAFVPIMTGCNNFCSYCVVPYTRGPEKSRPANIIIKEIKNLLKKGHKEITLLGQNVNSWESGFSGLLRKINNIKGDFVIKFISNHPKDFSDQLINTISNCEKIAKEIHLPVQSGDDKILKKMNRGYTAKQYKDLVKKIKNKIPKVKLSTDVIVGFPGETKKQFKNTVKLFKQIKYDLAYINKYSPRPGTVSSKWKDNISWEEKKHRWKILNDIANSNQNTKPKLIAVIGPTASGKSELAVKLALQLHSGQVKGGEIVSADSRQVYKEMDIGTGKITKSEMNGIVHYCLDIASPKRRFTVAQYKKNALKAIDKIYKKNKIPILCGGTGFYIQAVAEGLDIPKIKPDYKLRKKLEQLSAKQLFNQLKKLDPRRAKNIDPKNKRRLIRALEINKKTQKPVPLTKHQPKFDVLYLGIKPLIPKLEKKINKRVDRMIKKGLEQQVKRLVKKYGWTTVLKNTIGYKEWKADKPKKEIIEDIKQNTFQYAKKQLVWLKKYPGDKIYWIENHTQAKNLVKEFLKNKQPVV